MATVAPPAAPPGDPPTEPAQPELPPQPVEPEEQADQIAMADYFAALKAWQTEVDQIQADYEAQLADYRVEVQAYQDGVAGYQAELQDYQTAAIQHQQDLTVWQVARESAAGKAESLIGQINRDFGWTFVDKSNLAFYYTKILSTWVAQLIYSGVLFVLVLILQKRKDVV